MKQSMLSNGAYFLVISTLKLNLSLSLLCTTFDNKLKKITTFYKNDSLKNVISKIMGHNYIKNKFSAQRKCIVHRLKYFIPSLSEFDFFKNVKNK